MLKFVDDLQIKCEGEEIGCSVLDGRDDREHRSSL
jgi:hypothetical protein